jgi:hypothetical protein
MKTWSYLIAGVALATAGLMTRIAWSTKKCADAACDTPEGCDLRFYATQKAAFAEMFADGALATAYVNSRTSLNGRDATTAGEAYADAIKLAMRSPDMPLPRCPGSKDLSESVGMATDIHCNTTASVIDDHAPDGTIPREIPAQGKAGKRNGDLDGLKTCKEELQAAEVHEAYHRDRCAARNGARRDLAGYLAEDVAAYKIELASLKATRDAGKGKCSPTRKDIDDAAKFLKDAIAATTAANEAEKAAAAKEAAEKAAKDAKEAAESKARAEANKRKWAEDDAKRAAGGS